MKKFLCLMVGCLVLGAVSLYAEEMKSAKGQKCDKEMMEKCMADSMKGDKDISNVKKYLHISSDLGLTNEQVKSLEDIKTNFAKESIKINADMEIAHIDLGTILKQDNPDFTAARAKVKEICDLKFALKSTMIDSYEKAYNTLTAEQKAKLPQLKVEMKEHKKSKKSK